MSFRSLVPYSVSCGTVVQRTAMDEVLVYDLDPETCRRRAAEYKTEVKAALMERLTPAVSGSVAASCYPIVVGGTVAWSGRYRKPDCRTLVVLRRVSSHGSGARGWPFTVDTSGGRKTGRDILHGGAR